MNSDMMLTVGETFPLNNGNYETVRYQDGSSLEVLEDGGGLFLTIFLNKPKQEEIRAIRNQKMNVRLFQENDFILPMIRFGSKGLIFELSFDPTLYQDARVFDIQKRNNQITVVLIDSSNFKINVLRRANLPLKFIQLCMDNWSKAFLTNDFANRYKSWYQELQNQSTERLWLKADYVGKMGEAYNLEELLYKRDSDFYSD